MKTCGGVLRQPSNERRGLAREEACVAADTVVSKQSGSGAWPRSWYLFAKIPADEMGTLQGGSRGNKIDNDATGLPTQFPAQVAHAIGEPKHAESFKRGLDHLSAAQDETCGWSQYYPLRKGCYQRITHNDNAMINVTALLRDVARGEETYALVDDDRAAKTAAALVRSFSYAEPR